MSTVYYPTMKSPGALMYGPPVGSWREDQAGHRPYGHLDYCFELQTSKTDGGEVQTLANSEGDQATGSGTDVLWMVFVTPRLAAMTVGGTLDLCLFVRKDNEDTSVVYRVHVYVSQGNTRTVRATLLNGYVDSNDWPTTATFTGFSTPQALTPAALLAGDRIVVEIGRRVTVNPASDSLFTLQIGTTNNTGVTFLDGSLGGTTTSRAGFITFSQTHTAYPLASPPPHDDAADAIAITSLPYRDDTGYNTTVSADTDKAVWYSWLADRSGPVMLHALGSNYNVLISVTRDTPTGTGIALNTKGSAWVQRAAAISTFTATEGVQYYIKIRNSPAVTPNYAAAKSGGYLQQFVLREPDDTLVRGDLIVDCQHVVKVRDGAILNFCGVFFDLTPTGNAIDYSAIPMEIEGTGGETSTAPRLAFVLFPYELVEFIDLATLGRVQGELNFIAYSGGGVAGDAAPADSHPSHIAFDRLYRPWVGHFGDAYDFIGAIGSAASAKLRQIKLDTVAYEVLQAFTVTQDVQASDYFDIDAANEFIYYTSAGRHIYKLEIATGTITVWATIPQDSPGQPRPGLRGLRLCYPGDGSTGLIVADGINVKRVVAGSVVQTYTPALGHTSYDLDKVEWNPEANGFWVSDQLFPSVRFFTLAGVEQAYYPLHLPTGQLCGFAVYQGFRAGLGPPGDTLPGSTYEPGPFDETSGGGGEVACVTSPPSIGCWAGGDPTLQCAGEHEVPKAACWNEHDPNAGQIGLAGTGQP